MTRREYERMTAKQFIGRKVRAVEPMRNGNYRVAMGTVLTVRGKGGGLQLETDTCKSCGVSVYIRKVQPHSVHLLPL